MGIPNKFKKEEKQLGGEKSKVASVATHNQPALLIKRAWISERAGDLSAFGKYIFIVEKKPINRKLKSGGINL